MAILNNLPKFKAEGAPFAGADMAGRWIKSPGTLKQLSDSVDVGEFGFADPDEPIRAIPDPWAQPRTFAEALTRPHSLTERMVPQWRGLLALIALRDHYQQVYSLSLESFTFGETLPFDRVLSQLAPRFAISGETALWKRPTVIRLYRKKVPGPAIGILNPACLVSPARISQRALKETLVAVPWMRDGIGDPTKLPADRKLPKPALAALYAYLDGLYNEISNFAFNDERNAILAHLNSYKEDVRRDILGKAPQAAYAPDEAENLPRLYATVWGRGTLPVNPKPWTESEGLLKLRADVDRGKLQGVILVDPALAARDGRQGHSIAIWGHKMLSELLADENEYASVKEEAAGHGYLLVKAGDLFTERAAGLDAAKVVRHIGDLHDMLLPARPLVMLLDGDLAERFSVQKRADAHSVRMRVDIVVDHQSAPVTLVREYRVNPNKGEPEFIPDRLVTLGDATIWPDFRHPKWKYYYARFAFSKRPNVGQPKRALSAAILAAALRGEGTPAAAVNRIGEINRGVLNGGDQDWLRSFDSQLTETSEVERVDFSDLGFEAVFYEASRSSGGEDMIGCATLPLRSINPDGAAGVVAVDFGTTSTVACMSDGDPIEFGERLIHPIELQGSADPLLDLADKRWKLQEFLPVLGQRMPVPSVALLRRGADKSWNIPATRHVDFINYEDVLSGTEGSSPEEQKQAARLKLEKYGDLLSRMRFNLKWSHETDVIRASSDYLRQLLMMIAAEAAAKGYDPATLRWRFSRPDSLGETLESRFLENLRPMVMKLSPEGEVDNQQAHNPLMPEGFAAARYMLHLGEGGMGVVQGSINLVLDIGGGTTDVSIWCRNKELWKGSFSDLAGKHFFTETLINDTELMREMKLDDFAAIIDLSVKGKLGEKRTDLAELLFNGKKLDAQLRNADIWSEVVSTNRGRVLRATTLTFLGGVAYYLGLVVRQLIASGKAEESDLASPLFALCGRGAGIFRQGLTNGREDPNFPVTAVLGAFSHAAGAEGTAAPRLIMSPAAKLEVVRGMVISGSNMEPGKHQSEIQPAGISVELESGASIAVDADMNEIEARRAKTVDPAPILDLLGYLKSSSRIDINLAPKQTGQLSTGGADAYGAIAIAISESIDAPHRPLDPRPVEPPFIAGLRELVRQMGKTESGDKHKAIQVAIGGK